MNILLGKYKLSPLIIIFIKSLIDYKFMFSGTIEEQI